MKYIETGPQIILCRRVQLTLRRKASLVSLRLRQHHRSSISSNLLRLAVLDRGITLGIGRHALDGARLHWSLQANGSLGGAHALWIDVADEDIVVEITFLLGVVREDHLAVAVLDAADPLSDI